MQVVDLLQAYAPCKRFGPLDADISYFTSTELDPALRDWAFALCKDNMTEMYGTAWGWNDARKMRELQESSARFLVVFRQQQPVGFIHLRCGCAATGSFVCTSTKKAAAYTLLLCIGA